MKKIVAFVLAAIMLCSFTVALADGMPKKGSFASMQVRTDKDYDVVYISLSKPVDKLYANWPSDLALLELTVDNNLEASVFTYGHSCSLGVVYKEDAPWKYYSCSDTWGQEIATQYDRAFVTLQGNYIVCYNRYGDIVEIVYTATRDIQDIRDVAFQQ